MTERPHDKPQPVVIEVQRPRTQDLAAAGSDRVMSKVGAVMPVILSIGAGIGGIVKTYHQVEENRVQIEKLERRVKAQKAETDWICVVAIGPKECFARRSRGLKDDSE